MTERTPRRYVTTTVSERIAAELRGEDPAAKKKLDYMRKYHAKKRAPAHVEDDYTKNLTKLYGKGEKP